MAAVLAPTLVSTLWPAPSGGSRAARNVLLALVGTLALTVSAKTQIPFWPVPMTMQTFVVLVIGMAYGSRLGVATVALYLLEGTLGLPVFAGTPEKGIGLAYMMGPTGGYLAGFLVMAAIVGWAADRGWDRSVLKLGAAMLVAEIVMMAMGFAWLAAGASAWLVGAAAIDSAWLGSVDKAFLGIGFEAAWTYGVLPFIVPDLIKVALAATLVPASWALLPKRT